MAFGTRYVTPLFIFVVASSFGHCSMSPWVFCRFSLASFVVLCVDCVRQNEIFLFILPLITINIYFRSINCLQVCGATMFTMQQNAMNGTMNMFVQHDVSIRGKTNMNMNEQHKQEKQEFLRLLDGAYANLKCVIIF